MLSLSFFPPPSLPCQLFCSSVFILTSALFSPLPLFQEPFISLTYFSHLHSSSSISTCQTYSLHYYLISLTWHSDKLVCHFLSLFTLLLPFFHLLFWFQASNNEQSSSSPGQSKQNQSHIPQAQFAVTSQLCELGVFKLEVWRSSWVAYGC